MTANSTSLSFAINFEADLHEVFEIQAIMWLKRKSGEQM